MNNAGRAIKGGALALAIFIICVVISAICAVGMGVGRLAGIWDRWDANGSSVGGELAVMEGADWSDWTVAEARRNLRELRIDVKTAAVRFVAANEFRVETNNPRMIQRYENGRLSLIEESFSFWDDDWESELLIYWPSSINLERLEITSGAAQLRLGELVAAEVKLDLGAGRVEVTKLVATRQAEIEGGAGLLEILDGEIRNLNFDMGVGRAVIKAKLLGKNEISAGVGRLELGLKGERQDYTVKANKGLGSIRWDGQELQDDQNYGNGATLVKIDGGVGTIDIQSL